jgi:DNA (cytosine-5)-methyltransferase 1
MEASGQSPYGVKLIRGPVVEVPPHPRSCDSAEDLLARLPEFIRPKAADLFCGAGGVSLGLMDAGFDVIVGVDHDADALRTHAGLCPGWTADRDLSDPGAIDEITDLLVECDLALIAGAPPCQPFSRAGMSKIRDLVRKGRRDPRDKRRDLWEAFIEICVRVQPPVVLFENVPDMAFGDEVSILRRMTEALEESEYTVHAQVMSAAKHGVPQYRQRLLLVALRQGHEFHWPRPTRETTVADAIGDLPTVEGGWRPEGGGSGFTDYQPPEHPTPFVRRMRTGIPRHHQHRLYDHITRPVREDDARAFALMDSSTLYADLPGHLKRYRDDIFDDKYKRLDDHLPSRSITAHIAKDGYWYIHPTQSRTLTVREAARLQTFPDRVRFAGPPSAAFRQIGNAVPPRLAERIGKRIIAALSADSVHTASTRDHARSLSDWILMKDQLAAPWLEAQSPWTIIQAELLLGRSGTSEIRKHWPRLEKLDTPALSLDHGEELRASLGPKRAERVLEAARWYENDRTVLDSDVEIGRNPHVPTGVAKLAALLTSGDVPGVLVQSAGLLRVAARFTGRPVDKVNRGTEGRMAIARLVGGSDLAPRAMAGLIEVSRSVCLPDRSDCPYCPLSENCRSAIRETKRSEVG